MDTDRRLKQRRGAGLDELDLSDGGCGIVDVLLPRRQPTPDRPVSEMAGTVDAAADLRRQAEELLRQADRIESQNCTGLTAIWCGVHGDCSCPDREGSMSDFGCPLHSPRSSHAVDAATFA